MNISTKMAQLLRTAVVPIILVAVSAPAQAVPITYGGYDAGAGSLGTAPNATAAAAAFDAAIAGLSIIDFETDPVPGFSVTGDYGSFSSEKRC